MLKLKGLKVRLINWTVKLGHLRGHLDGSFTIDDRASDEEIEEMIYHEAQQLLYIEWSLECL